MYDQSTKLKPSKHNFRLDKALVVEQNIPGLFNRCNSAIIVILLLFSLGLFLLIIKRKQAPFVKIEDRQLQYFCVVKKEIVTIPADEIIKVTTQFCELQIHTSSRTHCLNLNHIKEEKQRWEIKEMIRKLAPENGNRVINF